MCCANDFGITDKEFLFVKEYIACYLNGTQAYVNVYNCKNRDTARVQASKLLTKPNVQACKDKLLSEITFNKQAIIKQSIMNLIAIANGNIDEETRIEVGKQQKKIKTKCQIRDRIDATELLLKLYNAFETETSTDEEEDIESLKASKENAKEEIEIKELEDER